MRRRLKLRLRLKLKLRCRVRAKFVMVTDGHMVTDRVETDRVETDGNGRSGMTQPLLFAPLVPEPTVGLTLSNAFANFKNLTRHRGSFSPSIAAVKAFEIEKGMPVPTSAVVFAVR